MTASPAQALDRDAAELLLELRSGAWKPSTAEQQLAEDLARGQWDTHWFRAGLRDLPPVVSAGRLAAVIATAALVAEAAGTTPADSALRQLRLLLDAAAPAI